MFNVLKILATSFLTKLVRRLYWVYRLSKIKIGKNALISFPIIIEGKGKIYIETNCVLEKYVKLAISEMSNLVIGDNAILMRNSTIALSNNANFKIGKNFKLENNSRIYVGNNWIISDEVQIATNCSIFARETEVCGILKIGTGSHIGDNTLIDVCDNVFIGNEVAIGPNCVLYTHDHNYLSDDRAAWKGNLKLGEIIIHDGAWIGSSVTILPGVTIGKRAIIAAGAVVTKSIPAFSLYGGIPAKCIKANYND